MPTMKLSAPAYLAHRGQALDVLGQQFAEEVDLGRQALECVLLREDAQVASAAAQAKGLPV